MCVRCVCGVCEVGIWRDQGVWCVCVCGVCEVGIWRDQGVCVCVWCACVCVRCV